MLMIESRPIEGRSWEYRFFVDFEGNLNDPAVQNALRDAGISASQLGKVLLVGGSTRMPASSVR